MKVKSVIAFFNWEITKLMRPFQKWLDEKTWLPVEAIDTDKLFTKLEKGNTFFIQVGANDGITGDKLHSSIRDNRWKGILIEPVPHIFKRLIKNYENYPGLIFENCAIGKEKGILPFYSIAEYNDKGVSHKDLLTGYGLDQLGSFDKATILKHSSMVPDFESFIKEIDVPTITISDLIAKHLVQKIDLMQIDTEGYDFEIVNNIDFNKVQPKIFIFEHQHISRSNYKKLVKKLRKKYNIFVSGWDAVCIFNEPVNA